MFRFHKSIPTISVFHNRATQSNQVLQLLRSAGSSPYPPKSSPSSSSRPLEFELSAVETPPTPDQIRTILSYLRAPLSTLISAQSTSTETVDSPESLYEAASRNPKIFRYPVVCNWEAGEAATDLSGVKKMLDRMAKERDSGAEDGLEKPKGWFS